MSRAIPESWKKNKLINCVLSKGKYGANASAVSYSINKPRYIRITDIDESGRLIESGAKSIEADEAEGYLLDKGDFLFARTGNTVGKTYLHKQVNSPMAFAGYLINFKCDKDILIPEYLEQHTHSSQYYEWIGKSSRVGAQPNINGEEYGSMTLSLPPITEQKKIAQILSSVDEVIELTEKEISKLNVLKRGMMQDLLTKGIGHTKFKDSPVGRIPVGWEVNSVKDCINLLTDYHSNGSYQSIKDNVTLLDKPSYAVMLRTKNFNRKHRNDYIYVDKHAYDHLEVSKVYAEDIIMNKIADPGRCFFVDDIDGPTTLGMNLFLLRSNNEKVVSKYLFYQLVHKYKELKKRSSGSTTETITKNEVRSVKLPIPCIDEQIQIVRLITVSEEQIELKRKKLEKLNFTKKALMQDLLTGKKRVKV